MNTFGQTLKDLGITLPQASKPAGSYTPFVIVNNLIFISGQTPKINGEVVHRGMLRNGDDIEVGRRAARLCAINILSQLELACEGDLSKVTRCVRVGGFVSSAPDFLLQSQVIDGASQLFLQAFGDAGRHARTSIGVAALPGNAMVEVDAIFAAKFTV